MKRLLHACSRSREIKSQIQGYYSETWLRGHTHKAMSCFGGISFDLFCDGWSLV